MPFNRVALILCACGLFFSACEKPVLEDTKLIPEDNLNIRFTDTLTVIAYTVEEEPYEITVRSTLAVGTVIDPDLGTTQAGFYVPFSLPKDEFEYLDSLVLDSVVLSLPYSYLYGDSTIEQDFEVFELAEPVKDTAFTNTDLQFNPVPVGVLSGLVPNTIDNIIIPGDTTYPPHLRIKLDTSFGQKILNASQADLLDEEGFRNFFKGLYVKGVDSKGGKGLVFITTNSNLSCITLYVHNGTVDTTVRFKADFGLNHFAHDYSHSTVAPYITSRDSINGDSLIFIQGMAGLNAKFIVPYFKNLGNIAVNKAELVLTQDNEKSPDVAFVFAPRSLVLFSCDENGDPHTDGVPDQLSPPTITGGTRVEEFDSILNFKVARYKFSLSRYYQDVVKGEQDNGIFMANGIRSGSNLKYVERLYASRLIAGGSGHSKFAIKLNLTYTVIE